MMFAELKDIVGRIPGARSTWGFFRYLYFQIRLKRATTSYIYERPYDEFGFPLPPPKLRYRVDGTLRDDHFLETGRSAAESIRIRLTKLGKDLNEFSNILDFGCGCGRVTRFLQSHTGHSQLYGCDIDDEAITWCQENMDNVAKWYANSPTRGLEYPDNKFDLIYGISVFTHLDEEMETFWLEELRRVSARNSVILLTIHGESLLKRLVSSGKLSPRKLNEFSRNGFLYYSGQTGSFKLDGLPDFYQTAFHSKEYIGEKWSDYFHVLDYVETNYQDMVVLSSTE